MENKPTAHCKRCGHDFPSCAEWGALVVEQDPTRPLSAGKRLDICPKCLFLTMNFERLSTYQENTVLELLLDCLRYLDSYEGDVTAAKETAARVRRVLWDGVRDMEQTATHVRQGLTEDCEATE